MSSLNKVILIGNLGGDPEMHATASGSSVANANLATSETWKDKQTGEKRESTEWHRLVFFNRLAEIAGEYLRKGSKIYVEGQIKTRKWQDQSGADRYSTQIWVSEMKMLDGRGGSTESSSYSAEGSSSYAASSSSSGKGSYASSNASSNNAFSGRPAAASNRPPEPPPTKADFDGFDDDIPF